MLCSSVPPKELLAQALSRHGSVKKSKLEAQAVCSLASHKKKSFFLSLLVKKPSSFRPLCFRSKLSSALRRERICGQEKKKKVKKSSPPQRAVLFVTHLEIYKLFSVYLSNSAILGFAGAACAGGVCAWRVPVLLCWGCWWCDSHGQQPQRGSGPPVHLPRRG